MLKEAAPQIIRVGYLNDARIGTSVTSLQEARASAHTAGLTVQMLGVRELHEVDRVLTQMGTTRGGALIVPGAPLFMAHASDITKQAAKYGLPAIYGVRVFMDAGGLMFYCS